jgi:hypothetical protein
LLGSYEPRYAGSCLAWLFVFPDADDCPAGRVESAAGVGVSLAVAGDLRLPVPVVDPGLYAVLGTAMPKAAIDEDRHVRAGEDDVSDPGQPCERATVD